MEEARRPSNYPESSRGTERGYSEPPGLGYVVFAATLFLILGIFNIIDGLVAIIGDRHFATDELFFGDIKMWGWIILILGGLQLLASFRLFSGKGQWLGIFLASLSLIAQLFFIGVYPVWSIIIMVIDAIVIFGLTVYGDQFENF